VFRGGLSAFFPEQWDRLVAAVPNEYRCADVVEGYGRMLACGDEGVRELAAYEWCLWESASPSWPPLPGLAPRFEDPAFRMAFARIVTHYVSHNAWIKDEELLRKAHVLAHIPGVLITGRYDFQAPIGNAWELKKGWPSADLVVVDDAGHAADAEGITREIARATNGFSGADSN
jgi:proline iminopeptidase